MQELVSYLLNLLEEEKEFLVLGHPHADPDAVGSMLALKNILESFGASVVVGVPSNIDKLSKSVLKLVEEEVVIDPPLESGAVVVVDTSSLSQLEDYESEIKNMAAEKVVFIDHHRLDEETKKWVGMYYADEGISSTVELIVKLAKELNVEFTPELSTLMLTGIVSDTGHFRFANHNTFWAVTDLLSCGADYDRALDALEVEDDPSRRVAMLKAAQRMEIYSVYDRWIVFSQVGAYESDAASLFVRAGADVSLVASVNDDDVRISSRARSGVASETHLHLGELMSYLADQFDGTGGGHAGAAAVKVDDKLDDVKDEAIEKVKDMLKPKEGQ